MAIKSLRLAKGLSQRLLAQRMGIPRSWVSKVESRNNSPTLPSLERVAKALEMSVPELLEHAEKPERQERNRVVTELVEDQFVAEIIPHVSRLSGMQRAAILAQMRDLTTRQRSRAV